MKAAIKEYNDLCLKPNLAWAKKHWKGYSVFLVACLVIPTIVYKLVTAIKESDFTKVFKKDEEDEAE